MDKQGFILHEDVSYIISVKLEELSTAAIIEPTTIQINNLTSTFDYDIVVQSKDFYRSSLPTSFAMASKVEFYYRSKEMLTDFHSLVRPWPAET